MKLASEIKNLNVFSLYEKQIVGTVKDIIIDPANGKFIAITVQGNNVYKNRNTVSSLDIKHLDREVLIVESKDAIGSKEDLPKAYDLLKSKIKIIGSKVVTEEGKRIGRVVDFALDTNLDKLARLYIAKNKISSIVGKSLIYPYDQIVKIEKNKITVLDYTEKVKPKITANIYS